MTVFHYKRIYFKQSCDIQVCTKDDTCFCDDGWIGDDCTVKLNITRVTLSVNNLTPVTKVTTTTVHEVRVKGITPTTPSAVSFSSTDSAQAAVIQGKTVYRLHKNITLLKYCLTFLQIKKKTHRILTF